MQLPECTLRLLLPGMIQPVGFWLDGKAEGRRFLLEAPAGLPDLADKIQDAQFNLNFR